MKRLTLQISSYDLRNGSLQSLKARERRWSGRLVWIGMRGPGVLPLFTLMTRRTFPWMVEVSVWLAGVNRREEGQFVGWKDKVWEWRVTD